MKNDGTQWKLEEMEVTSHEEDELDNDADESNEASLQD
ncbi:hypothetical protein AAA799E16_00063 [Marine Group I thaumarchaeote SCGC AAA799-E16]|uniref:Uncharacterized protein n=5 Tax=Marine Group I TaxID=905826 RepID=A0A087S754_9ARCH|nr:hypothetical protein AAA799E16_00063 [Marine Group I thaumarchaeote SCGC AAA799-E16]KFM17342.1 hypothetical protein AAA799D11_00139 [Marine Group I thaumarchaeote SCGC AAA799-D11]KFM18765.1 hypothetical protein AAA799P11_00974 [Marine Group I thaumarchaeote SCGC AAA799-P11]KFM19362.1 hypothetical protein SCCGRSA3_00510 [Marine Group I thaumarchaeote SCGC RSA3]KFM21558.1 hypothetical protein AAA799B03_00810 [Marine Group I thaumarchaeote SCGC AAA799-B03]